MKIEIIHCSRPTLKGILKDIFKQKAFDSKQWLKFPLKKDTDYVNCVISNDSKNAYLFFLFNSFKKQLYEIICI